jgi:hypothetical protein
MRAWTIDPGTRFALAARRPAARGLLEIARAVIERKPDSAYHEEWPSLWVAKEGDLLFGNKSKCAECKVGADTIGTSFRKVPIDATLSVKKPDVLFDIFAILSIRWYQRV